MPKIDYQTPQPTSIVQKFTLKAQNRLSETKKLFQETLTGLSEEKNLTPDPQELKIEFQRQKSIQES